MEAPHPHSAIPAELSTFLTDFSKHPSLYVSKIYERNRDINAIAQQIILNLNTLIQRHRQDIRLDYIPVTNILHMKLPSKDKIVDLVLTLLFTARCPASEIGKIEKLVRTAMTTKAHSPTRLGFIGNIFQQLPPTLITSATVKNLLKMPLLKKYVDESLVQAVGKYPPEQRLAILELINSRLRQPTTTLVSLLNHLSAFPPEERPKLLAESSEEYWYDVMDAAKEIQPLEKRRAFIQAGYRLSKGCVNSYYCKMALDILKELPFGQLTDAACAQVLSFVLRVKFPVCIPPIVKLLRIAAEPRRFPAILATTRSLTQVEQSDNDPLYEIFAFFLSSPHFTGNETELVAFLGDRRFDKANRACMFSILRTLNGQQLREVLQWVKLSEEEQKTGLTGYDLLVIFWIAKSLNLPVDRKKYMEVFQAKPIPAPLKGYERELRVDLLLPKIFQRDVSVDVLQKVMNPYFNRNIRVSILMELLKAKDGLKLGEWAAESLPAPINPSATVTLFTILRIISDLGNCSKEKLNAMAAALVPLLLSKPNRTDLLSIALMMPPDSLEFLYKGLANKTLVKMLQEGPELRTSIYQHFQVLLSGLKDPNQANAFAMFIIKSAPALLLHEEHPIYQLALEVAAKSDPEQRQKANNPFRLHQRIREKVSAEPLIELEMPSAQIAGQFVSIDLATLRKRSEKKAYTFQDLPSGINLETVERLFGNIEARLNALPLEIQEEAFKSIESEFGYALKDLKEHILDLPLVSSLLSVSGGPHDPIENTMFYLFAILKAILAEDATVSTDALLSPQEKMFLACARNIRECPTGQRDAITNYFNYLPSPLRNPVQGEFEGVERLNRVIEHAIQALLNELLASEETFKVLLGKTSVPQLCHQTLYLKNCLYRQIGLVHRPIFDLNSGNIELPLIELLDQHPQRALEIFFRLCPPERVIATVKKAFAEEFKNPKASLYVPLSEYFEKTHGDFYTSLEGYEEGKVSETKYLRFDPKSQSMTLTDIGALSLLTGLVPYLNKRESINRESMAIDSRLHHERPPADEPPAKCHKFEPELR